MRFNSGQKRIEFLLFRKFGKRFCPVNRQPLYSLVKQKRLEQSLPIRGLHNGPLYWYCKRRVGLNGGGTFSIKHHYIYIAEKRDMDILQEYPIRPDMAGVFVA